MTVAPFVLKGLARELLRRRDFLAVSAAALLAFPVRTSAGTKWSAALGDYISSQLSLTHTPGLSVAMVKSGHTAFAQGYGYADVETASRVTPDTIFQVASVSKTVTATALMLLWQDGAFRLDDPIAPHLDFAVASPAFPDVPITFRQLFTHTSGISDAVYDTLDFSTGDSPLLRDFLVAYLVPGGKWYDAKKSWSDAKPGAAWSYSNVGVALLAWLGEKLSGKPFDAFTRQRISKPLGMNGTSWRYEGVSDDRLAQPYAFADGRFKHLPRRRYPDWPAGLLCTSARDFATFLASYTKATLLKSETIQTMFTPDPVVMSQKTALFSDRHQGLIWQLAAVGDSTIAFHPGGDPGASTLAAVDATHATAALCFANITPTKDKSPVFRQIVLRLLEEAEA